MEKKKNDKSIARPRNRVMPTQFKHRVLPLELEYFQCILWLAI